MQVVVVDLSGDMGKAMKAVECALATARATERRAEYLLALAKASPELLAKAQGIYVRAGARVRRLERVLTLAVNRLEGGM
jgi:hypothetical protein